MEYFKIVGQTISTRKESTLVKNSGNLFLPSTTKEISIEAESKSVRHQYNKIQLLPNDTHVVMISQIHFIENLEES